MTDLTAQISNFSQTLELCSKEILVQLAQQSSWDSRYRTIMLLGKKLPNLNQEMKSDSALVQGCESNVWLHFQWHNNHLQLAASSDAKIVKGLIAIVLAAYNNKTREEILSFDIEGYFQQLQLSKNLSPSRTNGLFSIVKTIQAAAR
ncbi:MAG: SufE family protein [Gammaproteobacteria bacterium]|nr:SufE family protein [Gammaproteobacteria bacterium]